MEPAPPKRAPVRSGLGATSGARSLKKNSLPGFSGVNEGVVKECFLLDRVEKSRALYVLESLVIFLLDFDIFL